MAWLSFSSGKAPTEREEVIQKEVGWEEFEPWRKRNSREKRIRPGTPVMESNKGREKYFRRMMAGTRRYMA